MGPHSEDGKGPGQISVQVCEEAHWETSAAKKIQDLGVTASGGGAEGSRNGRVTEVHSTEAEHGSAIYCVATDSGTMQAGKSVARSTGVLAMVEEGQNRPGGGEETGGGVNVKIGDGVGGGVRQGAKRGRRRGREVSGSERVKWSRAEDG